MAGNAAFIAAPAKGQGALTWGSGFFA
ncbi:hypothetical protein [Acidithiobacillus ferrooxidans]